MKKIIVFASVVFALGLIAFGISACSTYKVERTDIHISEPIIPESGYEIYENEDFSIYLPEQWEYKVDSAQLAFFDDEHGNSFSVIHEPELDFNTLEKMDIIKNDAVQSAKVIDYMGYEMLVIQMDVEQATQYVYKFNTTSGHAVNFTLSFVKGSEDLHETIFRSLYINPQLF